MLFNSFLFIFGFLPLSLIVFYGLSRFSRRGGAVALSILSLGFYAWWRPVYLWLLLASIVFNYLVGARIQRAWAAGQPGRVKLWLAVGLTADLGLLGYFKYANFFVENLSLLAGRDITLTRIALPLAISFFTFQKIAYLVDSARGEAKKTSFLEFTLFATFFPQLIAGPIVHYSEIIPQLRSTGFGRLLWRNVLIGLTIFAIGLFKKSVLADTFGSYADPIYHLAQQGHAFDLTTGWIAAATYTLQLYFDFSGYSDMAIGLARMFGVLLPLNFHSPLRSPNIIDYWRRWHMTLQRFIVSYVFQPLSLPFNRWGARRGLRGWPFFTVGIGAPTFISFVLIGLWHGAGWTFILFGVMHAIYVCVNEAWRQARKDRNRRLRKQGLKPEGPTAGLVATYHTVTLLAVVFANVLFRADSVAAAVSLWRSMVGLTGFAVSPDYAPYHSASVLLIVILGAGLVAISPNTQQIMALYRPAINWPEWRTVAPALLRWTWRPTLPGLIFVGLVLFLGIEFIQRGQAVFLYFNF